MMPRVAANLELEIQRADGTKEPLIVRIFAPVEETSNWACEVQFEGARSETKKIYGIDSWQALTLGLRLVRVLIESKMPKSAKLLYLGEPVTLSSLFGEQNDKTA